MTPDKKVEEYLERAFKIHTSLYPHIKQPFSSSIIEIAKMIQLEEQHQELVKLTRGTALVN